MGTVCGRQLESSLTAPQRGAYNLFEPAICLAHVTQRANDAQGGADTDRL
ncbi:hypothetical protein [Pseudomonas sp. USHLN015]